MADALQKADSGALNGVTNQVLEAGKRRDERMAQRAKKEQAQRKAEKEAKSLTIRQAVKDLKGFAPPSEKSGGEYDGYYTGDKNKDGSRKKKNYGVGISREGAQPIDTLIQELNDLYPQLGIDSPDKFWQLMDDDVAIDGDISAQMEMSFMEKEIEDGDPDWSVDEQLPDEIPEDVNPFEEDPNDLTPFSKQKKDALDEAAKQLANEISSTGKGKPKDPVIEKLKKNFRSRYNELNPKKKNAKISDTEILATALQNYNKYEDLWVKVQDKVYQKYKDDPVKTAEFDDIFSLLDDKLLSDKLFQGLVKETLGEADSNTAEIYKRSIEGSASEKAIFDTVVDMAMERLGLEDSQRGMIEERVTEQLSKMTTEGRKKYRDSLVKRNEARKQRPKKDQEQRDNDRIDRLIEYLNTGVFDNEESYNAVKDQLGLPDYEPNNAQVLKGFISEMKSKNQSNLMRRMLLLDFNNFIRNKDLFLEKKVKKDVTEKINKTMRDIAEFVKENSSGEIFVRDLVLLKVQNELKLSDSEAKIFADRYVKVFNKLAKEERAKARDTIVKKYEDKQNRISLPKERATLLEKLVRNDNLNVFDYEASYEAVAESLGLPSYTPEVASKIQGYMRELQKYPETGSVQQQVVVNEIQQYIADTVGIDATELVQGIYVTAMLSGWSTQMVNIVGGLSNLLGSNMAAIASEVVQSKNPMDFAGLIKAMFSGLGQGFASGTSKAKLLWDTGYASDIQTSQKFVIPSAIETAKFGKSIKFKEENIASAQMRKILNSPLGYLFYANKWIARSMQMADLVIRDMGRLSKAYVMAAGIAQKKGIDFSSASAIANEILHRKPEDISKARAKAISEGATGNMINVRAEQILMQNMDEDIVQASETFAGRASYNEPYRETIMGGLARGLDALFNTWIEKNPIAGRTAKLVSFPFIRIVSNVTDRVIDFTPLGFVRDIARARKETDYVGSPERYQQLGEAMVGATGMAMLYMMSALEIGEDEEGNPIKLLEFHGSGPKNPQDRYIWEQAGNLPFSFRIAGSEPIIFKDTPFALALGTLANIEEAIQDGTTNEEAVGNVLMKTFALWSSQSFLSGVENLAGILSSSDSIETKAKRFKRLFSGAPARLTFPAQNFFLQIDKAITLDTMENKKLSDAVIREYPFVRWLSDTKPMLNAFGEPIKSSPFKRFSGYDRVAPDDFAAILSDNGLRLRPTNKRKFRVRVAGKNEVIDMTEDEHYDYHKEASALFMKKLKRIIPRWAERNVPADRMQRYIDKAVEDARDKVYSRMNREKIREMIKPD